MNTLFKRFKTGNARKFHNRPEQKEIIMSDFSTLCLGCSMVYGICGGITGYNNSITSNNKNLIITSIIFTTIIYGMWGFIFVPIVAVQVIGGCTKEYFKNVE